MQSHARTGRTTRRRQIRAVTLATLLVASVVGGIAGPALAAAPGESVTNESTPDEEAPTADAGSDRTVDEDSKIDYDGSNSTDNVEIDRYLWDLDGDGITDAAGVSPSRTYAQPGTYEVRLTVLDGAMNADTDTVTLTVRDVTPPSADTGPDTTIGVGSTLRFDGSESTDNDVIDEYQWDFDGDGRVEATGKRPVRTFEQAGMYDVTLIVTDPAGNTDTDTVRITVDSEAPATDESTTSNPDGSGESETATDGPSDGTDRGVASSSGNADSNRGASESPDPDIGDAPASVSVKTVDGVTNVHVEDGSAPREVKLANASEGSGVSLNGLTIDTNASEFTLNVSDHRLVPGNLSTPNRTTVGDATAGYLQIDHSVPDDDIASVDLRVTVGWDALADGPTASEITLYRYHDGEWQALETSLRGYTDDGARLSASAPGLSVFAVGSRLQANISVDPTVHSERVQVGDPANVSARVTNHGTAEGFIVVGLQVDDETLDTASVPLDPGQSTTLQLAPTFAEPGRYDVVVEGIDAGAVTVTTEPITTPTPASEPTAAGNESTTSNAMGAATPTVTETAAAGLGENGHTIATDTRPAADRASGAGPGIGFVTLMAFALLTAVVRRRN